MKLAINVTLLLPVSIAVTTLTAAPSLAIANTESPEIQGFQALSADLLFVTEVVKFDPGKGIKELKPQDRDFYRTIIEHALGAPQIDPQNNNKDFLSLGLGGSAIFAFGQEFLPEVTLWETTWGKKTKQSDYDERVEVLVGNDLNTWVSLGIIKNVADGAYDQTGGATIASQDNNTYNYIKLIDVSPKGTLSADGFDVNAIAVRGVSRSIPEPGSLLGLLAFGIFGGSSVWKRRKQKA
jgi:PEP-CTERM motif